MSQEGSKVTTLSEEFWSTDSMGKKIPQKSYLQFTTGTVSKVITGEDAPQPIDDLTRIGSIFALPHNTNTGIYKESLSDLDKSFEFAPLLRGVQDVPVIGDQVLLCEFAGKKYYLGPLNVSGTPSPDIDPFRGDQITSGDEQGSLSDPANSPGRFNHTADMARRLGKRRNFRLDDPIVNAIPSDPDTPWMPDPNYEDKVGVVPTPISANLAGDTMVEGKYGNSIRLGSRNIHPNLIISNGRNVSSTIESTLDGSIFAMLNKGSLHEHFKFDGKAEVSEDEEGNTGQRRRKNAIRYKFDFADNDTPKVFKGYNVHRSITRTMQSSLGRGLGKHKDKGGKDTAVNDPNIGRTLWAYQGNQTFLNSGRLLFNARDESIFLSANQFINLGAVNNINLSTSNTCLVEAASSMVVNTPLFKVNCPGKVIIDGRNNWKDDDRDNIIGSIFLGNPAEPDENGELPKMGPAVVGDGLVAFFGEIIFELQTLCMTVAEAVNLDTPAAAYALLEQRAKALEELMEPVMKKNAAGNDIKHPEGLMNKILSNHVMIKK